MYSVLSWDAQLSSWNGMGWAHGCGLGYSDTQLGLALGIILAPILSSKTGMEIVIVGGH